MSPEADSRKKRSISETTDPAPDSDHRKRRRNRTTQSCLNCHTSKRMCDRKRPCGRCTHLGLTGLCVYEVGDPNENADGNDESSRLRKRIAELEGVVRELKNKPHPRWVEVGDSSDKWSSRYRIQHGKYWLDNQSTPLPPGIPCPSSSDTRDTHRVPTASVHSASPASVTDLLPLFADTTCFPSTMFDSAGPSPFSTPSPPLLTPTDDYHTSLPIGTEGDFDFLSLFSSEPPLTRHAPPLFSDTDQHMPSELPHVFGDSCQRPQSSLADHCGCLNDPSVYNVLLALSLRLRKASGILGRASKHRAGSRCLLNQRIADMDAFTTSVLDLATTTLDISAEPSMSLPLNTPSSTVSTDNYPCSTAMHGIHTFPVLPPHVLQENPSWKLISPAMKHRRLSEDQLMSWSFLSACNGGASRF